MAEQYHPHVAKCCPTQPATPDGPVYFLSNGAEVWQAECKTVGGAFVSLGGNGKTKASASSGGCGGGRPLLATNKDAERWIDPDDDSEDTGNALKKGWVAMHISAFMVCICFRACM